jgi:F-type H+-transporting ATPase subunit epsilon
MQLEILSVKGVLVSTNATSVVFPGIEGSFGAMDNHTPILTILGKGQLIYFDPKEQTLDINGGFVEIRDNKISVCLND